jgi:hypothetical protein
MGRLSKKNLLRANAQGITSAANEPSFALDPLCDPIHLGLIALVVMA